MNIMLGVKDVKGVIADLLEKLGGDDSFAWFIELKKFLRKEACWITTAQNMFNPHTYFTHHDGLWISDKFIERVLVKQPALIPYRGFGGIASNSFSRKMTYQEIIDEFLGGTAEVCRRAFTLDQIASLIDLQSKGENGTLLVNGEANIFFVLVDETLFVVDVGWSLGGLDWGVETYLLGGRIERSDGRVFRNKTLAL